MTLRQNPAEPRESKPQGTHVFDRNLERLQSTRPRVASQ